MQALHHAGRIALLAVLSAAPIFAQAAAASAVVPAAAAPAAGPSAWTGNFSFSIGQKSLDEGDWGDLELESQMFMGLEVDFNRVDWPASLCFEMLSSYASADVDDIFLDSTTFELRFGVRKVFDLHGTNVYAALGLTNISTNLYFLPDSGDSDQDNDSAMGAWYAVGCYWTVNTMSLGIQVSSSSAGVTLFDSDFQAGGVTKALYIGYHW